MYRASHEGRNQGKNMLGEDNATPNCCHALFCSAGHQIAIRDMSRSNEDFINVSANVSAQTHNADDVLDCQVSAHEYCLKRSTEKVQFQASLECFRAANKIDK